MSRIYGVNANRTDINKTEYLKLAGNCKENKIQGGNCPMKKSRSFIHYGKVLLIFAIFMLVPFTGCKNIFVPEPPATPEAAGSGGGITVTLRLFTGSARTVMPEYAETGSLNWKITASQGETAVEASGEYPDYTLSLPSAGEWIFNVTGLNNEGDEIFTGSVRMEITGTTATVSIPLSPGSAMTTGTGKISLTLTVPDTVKEVMYKLDPDGAFGELTSGNDNIYTLEKADVSAGTHTLSLYFLDGDGTTLYMCKETVNVWGGMTSDQWINTGNSAYINGKGEFELTETIIDEFLETMGSVVYVDGDSGSDDSDGVGSIFAPVASVSKAVEILRKANTEANYSATIMVSGATEIESQVEVNSGETLTVKGMGADASITNDKGRVFNITGGSVTLGDGITLTGTVTDDNGGAVYVAENGTFTMESGSEITGSTASLGGGVYVSTGGTFTMKGGTIQGQGNKKEIYSAKTFTITGKPTITNCTITLEQGAYIDVNGLNASDLSNVQLNLPDDFYTENAVLLENAGTKDICGKFSLGNPPPTGVWWIGLEDAGQNGILRHIDGTLFGDTVTVTTPPSDKDSLQDLVNDSADGEYKVEITGGGTITVDTTVPVPDGADVTIKPSSGYSVNITASGATTVFDVQDGGSLTLGGGGGVVNVSGDLTASPPASAADEKTLVNISSGGTVTIADNANIQNNRAGRGVTVTDGTLIMTGGSIKGNTGGYHYGSGVYVSGSTASFEMSGGEISSNKLELDKPAFRQGAGVMVCNGATFTLLNNGKIINNTGYEGVGVTVSGSTFNMEGGEISGNNGSGTSGGVYLISSSTMNMNGGKITRNIAGFLSGGEGAGGVFIGSSCNFTGSTAPDTTASITENYVANTNVDVYFQSGGLGAYSPGNVQVGNSQNP